MQAVQKEKKDKKIFNANEINWWCVNSGNLKGITMRINIYMINISQLTKSKLKIGKCHFLKIFCEKKNFYISHKSSIKTFLKLSIIKMPFWEMRINNKLIAKPLDLMDYKMLTLHLLLTGFLPRILFWRSNNDFGTVQWDLNCSLSPV